MILKNVVYLSFMDVNGYSLHHGDIVRVLNPAVVLCIRFKGARKLRGTPAMYRVTHELSSADQDGENDQQEDSVYVGHPVNPIIAAARAELLK